MTALNDDQRHELATGVTLARLGELTGLPISTLRHYDGLGLVPSLPDTGSDGEAGRRLYGEPALEALERVRALKADGLKLAEIAERLRAQAPASPSLQDEVARLRRELAAARARLTAVTASLKANKARLELSKVTREAAERQRQYEAEVARRDEALALLEQTRRRALEVEARAASLHYATVKPRILTLEPARPTRKRR